MFFDEIDWVEAARNDFSDPQGDEIRIDMIRRLAEWDLFPSCSGTNARSKKYQYHGRHFLMLHVGEDREQAAWFGFANSTIWIRDKPKKHEMELIIAYRRADIQLAGNEYRRVRTDPNIVGLPNNVHHGWVVEFDTTWNSREVWAEKLREVRNLGL